MKTNGSKRAFLLLGCIWAVLVWDGQAALRAGLASGTDTLAINDTMWNYQSFFEGNPVYYQTWENIYHADAAGGLIKKHGLEGDTLVDGLLYHRMSVKGYWENDSVQFWVRENEAHDKVWVRMPWDSAGQEVLVVDMSLKERDSFAMYGYGEWVRDGDSLSYCPGIAYYVVDAVYYQDHPGGKLKHIRLKPLEYDAYTHILQTTPVKHGRCAWRSRHLEFIEGVGSNLGFVYGRNGMVLGAKDPLWGPLFPLWEASSGVLLDYIVCMERDSVVYYEHPNTECVDCGDKVLVQWIYEPPIQPSNESIRSMSRYLRLSPNPARDRVVLQWTAESSVDGACHIELYTLQGLKLRAFTTDSWPYTLTVSDLPHGAYMLRVSPKDASAAWQATVRLVVL